MPKNRNNHEYCSLPIVPERTFDAAVGAERMRAILAVGNKWANGTQLHFYFFDREGEGGDGAFVWADGQKRWNSWVASKQQTDVVRKAFETWKQVKIGLEFAEVDSRDEAEIRIGFMKGDGAWSYVGRQVLERGPNERTMNFGWDITHDIDTAVHEIGHTLGLPHEHQNPNAGIVWEEEAVYAALAQPPNSWSREKTFYNILRKIPPDEVQGSSWDPESIMHYPFGANLIAAPEPYATRGIEPAPGLSQRDREWVQAFYPVLDSSERTPLVPFESAPLALLPGQQRDFAVCPDATRDYKMRTFGRVDTVMVLFDEGSDGHLRYRAGDDDSGEDRNAQIEERLIRGNKYVLRVRLYYSQESGETSVMMW